MGAGRVILRLRDKEFPDALYDDFVECVKSFLMFSHRSVEELPRGDHFFHVQPPDTNSQIPQVDPRFHIIIDLETDRHCGPLPEDFPHQIYRVSRKDNAM
ncbi:hypothetical protein BP00DRAFT_425227 [Aspergillus indologenus CBS 114.80]|uniref:Uncharacterized protein n=1 Tax=Aspergillus indologenus CBS 114.80 TaxID=1450541 RepID=A0A2V5I5I5_9EURO|nr:hypothetical protein BP00DRAFT_425227 [Aspergillus indologenus CBS 114.80]